MTLLIIIPALVLAIAAAYLYCIRPDTRRRKRMSPFEKTYIAHRGLFDNAAGIPESSIAAFKNAIANGYGIELDVQLTKDGLPVVFHDASLKRMCGDRRKVGDLTYARLRELRLLGTDERIPLFSEALDTVGGRVPLIVEVKADGDRKNAPRLTADMLRKYRGVYCVESFDPFALKYFRRNAPKVLRGQLSRNYRRGGRLGCFAGFFMSNLLVNFIGKPDFISYKFNDKDQFSYRLCRRLYHPVNAAWTIKDQKQLDDSRGVFEVFIFDGFLPE